jgi:hypothetical protein
MEEPTITLTLNERCTRAIRDAVLFTLEKWAGQEDIDQEQLIALKSVMHGCVLEFEFGRVVE